MTRRPAFDPTRLDDELDQLLPPSLPTDASRNDGPAPASTDPASPPAGRGRSQRRSERTTTGGSAVADDEHDSAAASGDHTAAGEAGRAARGSGGRPRRPRPEVDTTPTVSAVRIPKPLYDAVVEQLLAGSVERPSYAQIVAWTIEDHRSDVVEELERALTRSGRAPRGRTLASDVVPLALRFQPGERALVDALIAETAQSATRTAAVIAALRVAVKHGLPA